MLGEVRTWKHFDLWALLLQPAGKQAFQSAKVFTLVYSGHDMHIYIYTIYAYK